MMHPKEQKYQFDFPEEEVLHSDKEKEKRKENLYLGMILGNNYQRSVSISVLTVDGFKDIDLPLRATTESHAILSGGIKIPIRCIREVRIS
ncbi:MAG: hypothetical protein HKN92_09305 [Chitinophagales bacterium]|nr:hypothetical protein [Chitinophagales bacterium]